MEAPEPKHGLASRAEAIRSLLEACGSVWVFAVAGGGLCLGAMVWHVTFARLAAIASTVALVSCLTLGAVIALAAWIFSCAYVAKKFEWNLVTAMRYDAIAYAGFVAYPLIGVLPLGPDRDLAGSAVAVSIFATATLYAIGRFDAAMRTTLWVFFVTKIPVIGIALLSSAFIPVSGHGHPVASTNPVLNIFARWDAVHYLEIARSGYHGADLAFFPLYPFLIRIGGWLLGSDVVAGLLVANIAFLFALYFLYRIAEAQFDSNVAARAALYLAIFPTAFFFVSLYSESLFLALTLAMFYALREQKWLIAGFVGGLAALTRVEGVLLVVCYIVEVLRPERNMLAAIRNSRAVRQHLLMGAGMIPGGLVAYMLLSWVLSNDPLAFTHLQSHWNRHPAWPWMSIWDTLVILATSRNPATLAVQSIQLAFTSLVICTTVYGLRRIRPSYSVFAAMSILVPLSTASLMSTPRFALAIFPVFIILGLWGKRDRVHTAVLLMALPLLGFFTVLFANWYWVA